MGQTKPDRRLKVFSRLLFVVYMVIALYILLLSENFGRKTKSEYRYNLKPFNEIKRFYGLLDTEHREHALQNLAGNVLCFVPFGLYHASEIGRKKHVIGIVTVLTCLFSLCVELTQLYFKIGIFDVDDLMLNTLGGMIGAAGYCGAVIMHPAKK